MKKFMKKLLIMALTLTSMLGVNAVNAKALERSFSLEMEDFDEESDHNCQFDNFGLLFDGELDENGFKRYGYVCSICGDFSIELREPTEKSPSEVLDFIRESVHLNDDDSITLNCAPVDLSGYGNGIFDRIMNVIVGYTNNPGKYETDDIKRASVSGGTSYYYNRSNDSLGISVYHDDYGSVGFGDIKINYNYDENEYLEVQDILGQREYKDFYELRDFEHVDRWTEQKYNNNPFFVDEYLDPLAEANLNLFYYVHQLGANQFDVTIPFYVFMSKNGSIYQIELYQQKDHTCLYVPTQTPDTPEAVKEALSKRFEEYLGESVNLECLGRMKDYASNYEYRGYPADAYVFRVQLNGMSHSFYVLRDSSMMYVPGAIHEHVIVVDKGVEPTCTTAGKTEGTHCSVCNKVIKAQTTVSALGHQWKTEYTTDKAATYTAQGQKSIHCAVCNAVKEGSTTTIPYINGYDTKTGFFYEDGKKVVDGFVTYQGNRYLLDASGKKLTGWKKVENKWYYLDNTGKVLTGFQSYKNDTYYLDENGVMTTGWQLVNDQWFYMNANGIMQTGWLKYGNSWYYLKADGVMATGWIKDGNSWYYLKDSGVMATGWLLDGNNWYYLKSSGVMQTGWLKYGNSWYFLKSNGIMATGWIKDGGSWYFLKDSGVMATGWLLDGNNWYYLKSSGVMQTGWLKYGNSWYYLKSNGIMATGWLNVGNKTYYLKSTGEMVTGKQVIDGKSYSFNAGGALIG